MSIAPPHPASAARPNGVRAARWPLAIGAAVPSAVLLVWYPSFGAVAAVALLLLASACSLELVRREALDPGSPAPIAWAISAVLAIAVLCPPRCSLDIWSYAMVGRLVVLHHASPYLHAPAAFPHDSFVALVGQSYRRSTTPYGPLFVVHAAFVALVAGRHPLLYRLAFQASAAAAIGAALGVLWWTSRSTSALALLGLHPVVVCAVVNGGHNDAFVGLGLLLAIVDTRRGRYRRAGWWITAALLVKVTAGLALLPIIGWAWVRGNRIAVRHVLTGPLLVGLPLMLITPGLVASLGHGQVGVISRSSIWNVALRLPRVLAPGVAHAGGAVLGAVAFAVVVGVGVCVALQARQRFGLAPAVVAALAAWLVFGGYVLPWYTAWALPAAALIPTDRISRVVALQGVAITAAFLIPRSMITAGGPLSDVVRYVIPVGLAALFLWALIASGGLRGCRVSERRPSGPAIAEVLSPVRRDARSSTSAVHTFSV